MEFSILGLDELGHFQQILKKYIYFFNFGRFPKRAERNINSHKIGVKIDMRFQIG